MKIAAIQMTTACDPADNLPIIAARVGQAAAAGAQLIGLPETCVFMERGRTAMRARLQAEAAHQPLQDLCNLAQSLSVWLLVGSLVVADEHSDKAVNRSVLIAPDGKIAARYDKINMFDVTLENGESHKESENYQAGAALVVSPVAPFNLGMSICYDVRFPNLYRRLAEAGADILSVPSAFTSQTGAAHWHILLRARAIETGSYVIAPAQVGEHENGRQTYGHSLIIDPWGKIIAEAQADDSFIIADIDKAAVDAARRQIPSLSHGRPYRLPQNMRLDDAEAAQWSKD